MRKRYTSVRLSEVAFSLWARLSHKLGISKASVLEMSIRLLAEREGIQESDPEREQKMNEGLKENEMGLEGTVAKDIVKAKILNIYIEKFGFSTIDSRRIFVQDIMRQAMRTQSLSELNTWLSNLKAE